MATFGIPTQVRAASFPRALGAARGLTSDVVPGGHLVRTVSLPWRANLVGVSFRGDDPTASGLTLSLRAHAPGGEWTAWAPLSFADGDAPDGTEARNASERISTDPTWVGTVDRVRVRIDAASAAAPIRDVRLELVNTLGDAREASVLLRAARALRSFLTMQPAAPPANAMTTQPKVLTRKQWGANESWRDGFAGYSGEVRMTFVHHTDNQNNYSRSQSAALVRGIYRYHVYTRGWSDIAYNFLVDKYGQIFEGRWGGITKPVIGAHTMGFNAYSTGVSMIGEYGKAKPSSAMLTALKSLLAWKMDLHHIPPTGSVRMTSAGNERYARGTVVSFNRISGHRNAKPTACPGNYLYDKLKWLRSAVSATGNPKIYLPALTTTTLRPDGDSRDETLAVTARYSRSVVWTLTFTDSGGAARKTFTGSGTATSVSWNGLDATSGRVPTGRYAWRLEAHDSANAIARAVSGSVYVITDHPDGTILSDASGRYVLNGLQWQEATDPIAYASNFGARAPVATGPNERSHFVSSLTALPLRNGTLLQNSDGSATYIWSAGALRQFASDAAVNPQVDAFSQLGYQRAAVITASQDYLNALMQGQPVNDVTQHPAGTVVKDPATGARSLIASEAQGLVRHPITELATLSRYRAAEVVTATAADLAIPLDTNAVAVRAGTLVRGPDGALWIVADGVKRKFISSTLFARMGYTNSMLIAGSQADLDAVPSGATLG